MGMFDDLVPAKAAAPVTAAAPAPASAPAGLFADLIPAPKQRSLGAELIRQGGLTARYLLEGVPQAADLVLTPVRSALDSASTALGGPRIGTLGESAAALADRLGLPQPETATERVVGDASRMVAGTIGGAGAAGALAKTAGAASPAAGRVLAKLAEAPGTQAISGATAGAAGGITREQGGTAVDQAAAALAGGVLAPLAAGGVQRAAAAGKAAIAQRVDPGRLDAVLKTELGRAGVNWDDLGAAAKLQLRKDAEAAVYSGQPLNADALRRLADYRTIGATPLVGDITQDPRTLTLQRNLSKQLANQRGGPQVAGADLPQLDNANARRVLGTLEGAADSPLDAYATGERIIGAVQGKDAALKAGEKVLYDKARDAAGRTIPLDRGAFVNAAFENLARTNRASFLPESVGKMLDQIAAGTVKVGGQEHPVPFDVDTIDQLKTVLASASRSTADGNTKAAIKAVRDALEGAQPVQVAKPAFGGNQVVNGATAQAMRKADGAPAEAMAWFDKARSAARDRRQWQESARFIEDALGGAAPDDFVKKHVIGATFDDLAKLRGELGATAPSAGRELSTATSTGAAPAGAQQNADALNAIRKQLVDYIMQRGRADSDTTRFSSAGMQDALKALGDRKLALFFSPDEIQQIKSAVNVGRYMQSQPIGSAVNNSNSGAMLMGRLSDFVGGAASKLPFGKEAIADPLQSISTSLQMRSLRDLSSGLATPAAPRAGAGASLVPLSTLLATPLIQRPQDEHRP